MPPYHHTQIGWTMLLFILAADAISVVAVGLAGVAWLALVIVGATLALWALFGRLTVRVDGEVLLMWFGWVGLIRRSWRLDQLVSVTRERNPWYTGWGIRLLPGRTVYNVSGFDAVEFELRDGRRYRIGTDEPAVLEAAIRERMAE